MAKQPGRRRAFWALSLLVLILAPVGGGVAGLGRAWAGTPAVQSGQAMTGRLLHWNEVAMTTTGLDHTAVAPGETRVFGEQFGPTRASRAMAIVHIALFEAVNAIDRRYQSYTGLPAARGDASVESAIALAAHDTLVALYPSQKSSLDATLTTDLLTIPDGRAKANGMTIGVQAAASILAIRHNDGSDVPEPHLAPLGHFVPGIMPGQWRPDPISQSTVALGAYWGQVTPFVMNSSRQFRLPPPPHLKSKEYAAAYNEVKNVGGDGIITPTMRTTDETMIGTFWAYDGTPTLCAPPRLYNQITVHIANQEGTDGVALARLLALVNVAMADACIAVWESKFYYQFWRPVTGIRESDPGTGPTGLGDGNPLTVGDLTYTPLGAPASNLNGPNFTPPFPSYPSGHAGIGGALFESLRNFYGTDDIAFTFVSDEFNGVTKDNMGNVRPLIPRSFSSLSEAEEENGQSRIYLGIHWAFDKTRGIDQGRRVADYLFKKAFQPLHGRGSHDDEND